MLLLISIYRTFRQYNIKDT